MEKNPEFAPYVNYSATIQYIEDFVRISELAYGITKQLMKKHSKDALSAVEMPQLKKKELSFSMADVKVKNVGFVCGWLSIQAYAGKLGSAVEEVEKSASEGKLGPIAIHPETRNQLIIWPQEFQTYAIEKLPEPGKSKFKSEISIAAKASIEIDEEQLDNFDDTQKKLLALAHSVGDTEELGTKAETMLFQSSFLLQWTAFETFIRETIHELYKRHPGKLCKGQKGTTVSLSYADVFEMSESFSSIDELRESIVNREIEKHKKDGASISGLINFLKTEFKFEEDPYSAWYVIEGDVRSARFEKVAEIKDVRNSLIHDAGKEVGELLELYPHLVTREGDLIVSKSYYTECVYVLRSIAFSIATSINTCKYKCTNC